MEVLVLLYLFDYYYLAVGGRYDQPLGVLAAEVAYRTSEEVEDDGIYGAENDKERPEGNLGLKRTVQYQRDGGNENETIDDGVCALAVDTYLF